MRSFSEIQPGMLLIGYVRNVMPFGVFVEFPFGVTGLAPKVVNNTLTSVNSMYLISHAWNMAFGKGTITSKQTGLWILCLHRFPQEGKSCF